MYQITNSLDVQPPLPAVCTDALTVAISVILNCRLYLKKNVGLQKRSLLSKIYLRYNVCYRNIILYAGYFEDLNVLNSNICG